MKKLFLLAPVLVACLSACNRQDSTDTATSQKSSAKNQPVLLLRQSAYVPVGPENNLNPYDSIGALHNEGLYFVDSVCALNQWQSYEGYIAATEMWMSAKTGEPYSMPAGRKQQLMDDFEAGSESFCTVGAGSCISGEAQDIMQTVFRNGFLKAHFGSTASYAAVKDSILKLENYFLANNNLTPNEKTTVFGFTSILRHSVYFGYKYYGFTSPEVEVNGVSPYNTAAADLVGFTRSWSCYHDIGIAIMHSISRSKSAAEGHNPFNHYYCSIADSRFLSQGAL